MQRNLIALVACALRRPFCSATRRPARQQGLARGAGLEAAATKEFQDYEAIVARVKGAKDAASAQERVVVFAKGKLAWQSAPKDFVEPAQKSRCTRSDATSTERPAADALHGVLGRRALLHDALRVPAEAQVRRHAVYPAKNVGGTDFMDLPAARPRS